MEKINALIDNLLELKNSGADLATISYYVQLLQAEVLHVRTRQHLEQLGKNNNNVAIILPTQAPITINATALASEAQTTTLPSNNPVALPVSPAEDIKVTANESRKEEANVFFNPQPVKEADNLNNVVHEARKEEPHSFFNPQPVKEKEDLNNVVKETPKEELNDFFRQQPAKVMEPSNGDSKKEVNSSFTANGDVEDINSRYHTSNVNDINSLAQAKKQDDLNSRFAQQATEPQIRETPQPQPVVKPQATLFDIPSVPPPPPTKETSEYKEETSSLNDRLRQQQVEIAQKLGEMPIKDLRQAIGINDKYQFIESLFSGNIDLYERSIKTINDCHNFQEADYWLQREIKIIQGWEDDHKVVQQFYVLLRKRFS